MALDEADYDSDKYHDLWANMGLWLGQEGVRTPFRPTGAAIPVILSTATPCFDPRPKLQYSSAVPHACKGNSVCVVSINKSNEHESCRYTSRELALELANNPGAVAYYMGCREDKLTGAPTTKLQHALNKVQDAPFHMYPTAEMVQAAAELVLVCYRLRVSCAVHVPGAAEYRKIVMARLLHVCVGPLARSSTFPGLVVATLCAEREDVSDMTDAQCILATSAIDEAQEKHILGRAGRTKKGISIWILVWRHSAPCLA